MSNYTPYSDVYSDNRNNQRDQRGGDYQRGSGYQSRDVYSRQNGYGDRNNYQRQDDYQRDDRRQARRSTGVQNLSRSEFDRTRRRELDSFNRLKQERDVVRSDLSANNLQAYNRSSAGRRDRSAPENPYRSRRKLRRSHPSSNESSSAGGEDNNNNNQRRAQSQDGGDEGPKNAGAGTGRATNNKDDWHGKLDSKGRPEDRFDRMQNTFDTSSDGFIAAIAGAGLGAVTARQFGGNPYDKNARHSNWKTFAGAAAGAVAFNAIAGTIKNKKEEREEEQQQQQGQGQQG